MRADQEIRLQESPRLSTEMPPRITTRRAIPMLTFQALPARNKHGEQSRRTDKRSVPSDDRQRVVVQRHQQPDAHFR